MGHRVFLRFDNNQPRNLPILSTIVFKLKSAQIVRHQQTVNEKITNCSGYSQEVLAPARAPSVRSWRPPEASLTSPPGTCWGARWWPTPAGAGRYLLPWRRGTWCLMWVRESGSHSWRGRNLGKSSKLFVPEGCIFKKLWKPSFPTLSFENL